MANNEEQTTSERLTALEERVTKLERQRADNREEIQKLKRGIKTGLKQLLAIIFGGEDDDE